MTVKRLSQVLVGTLLLSIAVLPCLPITDDPDPTPLLSSEEGRAFCETVKRWKRVLIRDHPEDFEARSVPDVARMCGMEDF